MKFFPTLPLPGDEIGLLENRQMFRDRLARHVQPPAQLAQRLAIPLVQPIQQLPSARIGQSTKHSIIIHASNMEPFGCVIIGNRLVTCQLKKITPTCRRAQRALVNPSASRLLGVALRPKQLSAVAKRLSLLR